MKFSDYVADFIAKQGVKYVFLFSGGAIVHICDSVSKHPNLKYICPAHEQGGAAAADGYSRVTGNIGVMLTTSGPGATNILTSVANAYYDSIPLLLITGQVATFRLRKSRSLRQRGFQETDVVSIFRPLTKYAVQIKRPNQIKYELQKAVYMAKSGRPGPVLIDIPDDVQREEINPDQLPEFKAEIPLIPAKLKNKTEKLISLLKTAKRPVLILGAGIRLAKSEKQALAFAEYFKLPITLTWGGKDLIPAKHPLNMGSIGVCGPRGGNFAVQNSDLIIAIGTRLCQMITGGKQELFAPRAKKVMVDVDAAELNKFKKDTFSIDLKICCHLADFFNTLTPLYKKSRPDSWQKWRKEIKSWIKAYPVCPKEYYLSPKQVNGYVFIKELSGILKAGDVVLADTGCNVSWMGQAFEIKSGQRLFSAWNHTPMGYALPASIGAALGTGKKIITITGDGGIMMCIEELGTIRRHDLPVKIFVFNNHGHGLQKQTMDTWLNSRYTAVDNVTGLWFPDFAKIARAFEMPYFSINRHDQIKKILKLALNTEGPVLINVEIVPDQKVVPMLKFGAGIEDLDPKLPAVDLAKIMTAYQYNSTRNNNSGEQAKLI